MRRLDIATHTPKCTATFRTHCIITVFQAVLFTQFNTHHLRNVTDCGQIKTLIDTFVKFGLSLKIREGGEIDSTLLRNENWRSGYPNLSSPFTAEDKNT
jgi:hypothetical protein